MASTAKSFLMSLLVLLATSPQALSNESKSENVKVRKLESDLIPGNGKVQVPPHFSGIPPKNSPHLNIPSYTPYTSNDKNTQDRYHTVVPDFRFGTPNQGRISSAPIPKPPQLNVPSNTPYTGIPPKKTPHSNIPPYRPYAGIAPRKPPHSYPGNAPKESPQNKSSTPNDSIAPRKPPHFKIPTYTPYTGIPPKNSPKNNIPSYQRMLALLLENHHTSAILLTLHILAFLLKNHHITTFHLTQSMLVLLLIENHHASPFLLTLHIFEERVMHLNQIQEELPLFQQLVIFEHTLLRIGVMADE